MGGGEGGASGDPTLTLSAEATGDSCPQPSRPNKVPGATRTTGHRTGLTHLWDVDEQTSVGDVGNTDEALLNDPLSLNLHTGHRRPGSQKEWRWPCAGMLSDVVDLLSGCGAETRQ